MPVLCTGHVTVNGHKISTHPLLLMLIREEGDSTGSGQQEVGKIEEDNQSVKDDYWN